MALYDAANRRLLPIYPLSYLVTAAVTASQTAIRRRLRMGHTPRQLIEW
jgi:hypothetical protein